MSDPSSRLSDFAMKAAVKYNVDPAILSAQLAHECDWKLDWIHNDNLVWQIILDMACEMNANLTYRQGSYSSALADFHAGRAAYDDDKDAWFGSFDIYCYPILDASGQGRHYKRLNN